MKQINGYWVDENNNRWNIKFYTEEAAEEFSKSLVNCYNCIGCDYCYNCQNCNGCRYCHNCHCCNDCQNCNGCRYCTGCINCNNCHDCRYCGDCRCCDYCDDCACCRYCRYCGDCRCCDYCDDYKQNPQRYTTKNIGSRNDQTTFYYGETKNGMEVQVVCGCFRGNLETFVKAVLETHKDNDLYRKQYLKEIEKVKILFELEVA